MTFRRYRLKRVYRILREYKLHKLRLMILARLLYGKKIELVIDGTIVDIAYVNRARTQKIRRVRGKGWRAKRRRKKVRRDYGKVVEFEEVKYGMLMMVYGDRGYRGCEGVIVCDCREMRANRPLWKTYIIEL